MKNIHLQNQIGNLFLMISWLFNLAWSGLNFKISDLEEESWNLPINNDANRYFVRFKMCWFFPQNIFRNKYLLEPKPFPH